MTYVNAVDVVGEAPGPAVAVDQDHRILAMNRPARKLLGYSARSPLSGEPLFGLLDARDVFDNRVADSATAFLEMAARREEVHAFEISVNDRSGKRLRVVVHVVVVLGPQKDDFGLVYLFSPVLRRRKADAAIERLLSRDEAAIVVVDEPVGTLPAPPRLTPRQVEVLRLLAQGANIDEIASQLGISVSTARTHLQDMFERMDVHSQVEAVARAYRERLI